MKHARRVRTCDRHAGRPLVASADSGLRSLSRHVDMLVARRTVLGTSVELRDWFTWLRERPRLARPGTPFTVYARSTAATARPTRNLDTYDPERKDVYESYNFEGRYRIPGGGQVFGGVSIERERYKACTAPDDPNYVSTTAGTYNGQALCDDFKNDIPFRPSFKLSGTKEIIYGINLSVAFQNNSSPVSSRVMTVTRGTTRYPANCPSPCPAGEIIMPTANFGQTTLTYALEPLRATSVLCSSTSRCHARSRWTALPSCRPSRCST